MIAELKAGMKVALDEILDFQVTPYMLANPTPPACAIFADEPGIDYHGTMSSDGLGGMGDAGGLVELSFTVQVFVSETADVAAQKKLDAYLEPTGARSIRQALEKEPTLGGACDDLIVRASSGYRRFLREGGGPVLGAEWRVTIYADGGA